MMTDTLTPLLIFCFFYSLLPIQRHTRCWRRLPHGSPRRAPSTPQPTGGAAPRSPDGAPSRPRLHRLWWWRIQYTLRSVGLPTGGVDLVIPTGGGCGSTFAPPPPSLGECGTTSWSAGVGARLADPGGCGPAGGDGGGGRWRSSHGGTDGFRRGTFKASSSSCSVGNYPAFSKGKV